MESFILGVVVGAMSWALLGEAIIRWLAHKMTHAR